MRLLLVAAAIHLLFPQLGGFRETAQAAGRLRWWLPIVAAPLEAASLVCFAEVLHSVLHAGRSPTSRALAVRTVLVGTAWAKVLPGGALAALPAAVGTLGRGRVDRATSAAAFVATGAVASLVLVALLPAALTWTWVGGRSATTAVVNVTPAALVTFAIVAMAWRGARHPRIGRRLEARLRRLAERSPRWAAQLDGVADAVGRAATALHDVVRDRRRLARAAAFAAASWLLDFAVIAVVALAVLRDAPVAGIGLVYVTGQLAAMVPVTPGGLGLVEATMTAVFTAQGAPPAEATAVVLGWRLVNYWFPVAAGFLAALLGRSNNIHGRDARARDRSRVAA